MTNKEPDNKSFENNNDNRTRADIFEEEIRKELAAGHIEKPSLDEFKVMVYKDRAKRRRKHTTIAAGVVIALLAGFFALEMCTDDVGADKNPKEEIVTEDGIIIEDGGWGSSDGEDDVIVVDDWGYIEDVKTIDQRILIPKYIPKEYMFELAKIEIIENRASVTEYTFVCREDTLEIEVYINDDIYSALDVYDVVKEVESKKGIIYIQKNNKATIQINDGIIINIWHSVKEQDLIEIVNSLE